MKLGFVSRCSFALFASRGISWAIVAVAFVLGLRHKLVQASLGHIWLSTHYASLASRPEGEHQSPMAQPTDKERQQKKRMEQAFASAQGAPRHRRRRSPQRSEERRRTTPTLYSQRAARRAQLAEGLKTRGNAHYSHGDDAAAAMIIRPVCEHWRDQDGAPVARRSVIKQSRRPFTEKGARLVYQGL